MKTHEQIREQAELLFPSNSKNPITNRVNEEKRRLFFSACNWTNQAAQKYIEERDNVILAKVAALTEQVEILSRSNGVIVVKQN